ncbi:hypothetical protein GCM10027053_25030 [Intrasporangium mesophilum]
MDANHARLGEHLIVDASVHVQEGPLDLLPYCDEAWRPALQSIADNAKTAGIGAELWPPGLPGEATTATPEELKASVTERGVDLAVLCPTSLQKLSMVAHAEFASAVARAYNAWLTETWLRPEQGLLGCVVASAHAPADSAAQIEKYASHPGVVGVYLPGAAVDPLWGHRKYDPILRAAESAGLPVLLNSVEVMHPVFPFNTHGFDTSLARFTTSDPFSMMVNLIDMITTGVPARFPDLRVGVLGAGVTWMPFLSLRLDKVYLEKRREVPFLAERPSQYLKGYFYGSFPLEDAPNPDDFVTMVDLFEGENAMVFASGWPQDGYDSAEQILALPFSDEAKAKIVGGNALRLFNIDERGHRLSLSREAASR